MKRLKNLLLGLLFLSLVYFIDHNLNQEDGMERETRKIWKWWFIAVLTIAVIRLLSACAPPHVDTAVHPDGTMVVPPVRLLDDSATNLGLTSCDSTTGEVVISLNPHLTLVGSKYVMIHEMTHVAQSHQFRSCREFVARYRADGNFRFYAEAHAHCAGYEALRADGRATHDQWIGLIRVMLRYDTDLDETSILPFLPCKEGG